MNCEGDDLMKRIIDCRSSDFEHMTRRDLLDSIAGCEGRTLCCETVGVFQPMLGDVTNAEFAAAMGADLLLLNLFDCNDPQINALPRCEPMERVRMLKKLTGRPIGINLEPVEQVLSSEDPEENMWAMTDGRKATLANARRAADMGVDLILLTGNPGVGVTNEAIEQTLRLYKRELGDRLVLAAGKMHAAGILSEGAEKIITKDDVKAFAEAGADIILMPHASPLTGQRRRSVWDRIVPARCSDNAVFAILCNASGENGCGSTFGSGASIVDPRGRVVAEDYSQCCMVTAELDPEDMYRLRAPGHDSMRDVYFLDRRRPELYEV